MFEGTPVLFAYLYGSFAKDLSCPFRDLDVGAYVKDLNFGACLKLELSLALRIDENLDHDVQSEVRVVNHLPLVVLGRIVGDGELIYSRDEMKRIDFETQIRKAYFDFLHVIQQYQNSYIKRLRSANCRLADGRRLASRKVHPPLAPQATGARTGEGKKLPSLPSSQPSSTKNQGPGDEIDDGYVYEFIKKDLQDILDFKKGITGDI